MGVGTVCIGVLLAFCAMAGTAGAQGRSPEDRYIATRDAAIARFTPEMAPKLGDKVVQEEEAARTELERQMRVIVGPVEIAGLGPGKLSLGSLYTGDLGFGSLDGLRVLKVLGCVNCTPDFIDQPKVINGCSDLFHELYGKDGDGYHARSAVGFTSLPGGVAVEIEAIFEVKA